MASGDSNDLVSTDGIDVKPLASVPKTITDLSATESSGNESLGTCSFCIEDFEMNDLYRCNSCHDANNVDTGHSSVDLFCEVCIVSAHLRKKHEIVDSKGYCPAVCEKHKTIARLFCDDCNLVFCSSCITAHRSHTFLAVSDKCIEARKRIFDYLTEFEVALKPIKHREDIARTAMEKITAFSEALEPENLPNTLSEVLEREVRQNSLEWQKLISREMNDIGSRNIASSKELLDVSVRSTETNASSIEKLKRLLQLSDGVCMQNFPQVELLAKSSLDEQSSVAKKHVYLSWSHDLGDIFNRAIKDALKQINIPKLESVECRSASLSPLDLDPTVYNFDWNKIVNENTEQLTNVIFIVCDLFNVSFETDSICFSLLTQMSDQENALLERVSLFNCSLKKVLICLPFLAFFTSEFIVKIFSLKNKCFVGGISLRHELDPLAFYVQSNGSFSFIVWDSELSVIEVYDDNGVHLPRESKPKLFKHVNDVWVVVESNDDVVLFNSRSKRETKVSKLHHGLSQVDNVCFQFPDKLKIMDYKLGLCLFGTVLASSFISTFSVKFVVKLESLSSPISLISMANSKYYVVTDDGIFVTSQEAGTASRTLDPVLFPESLTFDLSSSFTGFNFGQSPKPTEGTCSQPSNGTVTEASNSKQSQSGLPNRRMRFVGSKGFKLLAP